MRIIRNPALDRTDPIDASVTKLLREKERLAYWACRALTYLHTCSRLEREALEEGLARVLIDLGYDTDRVRRTINFGEPT